MGLGTMLLSLYCSWALLRLVILYGSCFFGSIQMKMVLAFAYMFFYLFCPLGVLMFLLVWVEDFLRSSGLDILPPMFFSFLACGLFMNFVHSQLKKVLKYKGDVEVTFFGVVKPCKKDS